MFKIPKKIHLFGKTLPTWGVAAGTLGIGALVLAIHHKWLDPPVAEKAGKIIMHLNPPQMQHGRPTMLSGQFQDDKGNPVRIKMGKFTVTSNGRPVTAGLIGPYASDFNTMIDTRSIPPGPVQVQVDDHL